MKADFTIFDTHLHLWEREHVGVSWTQGEGPFDRDFTIKDYQEDVKKLPVTGLYMEVNADADSKLDELAYINALIHDTSNLLIGGILFADPLKDDFDKLIKKYTNEPLIHGVRTIMHLAEHPKGLCLQENFMKAVKHLGDKNLTFDICLRAAELDDVILLAQLCPKTTFILDHGGCNNPDFDLANPEGEAWDKWQSVILALGKLPNVICKLSGFVSQLSIDWQVEDLKPVVTSCLKSFPLEQIIVGSDWPICTQTSTASRWFIALTQLLVDEGLPDQSIRKIFADNAQIIYKLRKA